jgi:hypothetical protein
MCNHFVVLLLLLFKSSLPVVLICVPTIICANQMHATSPDSSALPTAAGVAASVITLFSVIWQPVLNPLLVTLLTITTYRRALSGLFSKKEEEEGGGGGEGAVVIIRARINNA